VLPFSVSNLGSLVVAESHEVCDVPKAGAGHGDVATSAGLEEVRPFEGKGLVEGGSEVRGLDDEVAFNSEGLRQQREVRVVRSTVGCGALRAIGVLELTAADWCGWSNSNSY
jgi:hypothetical protein